MQRDAMNAEIADSIAAVSAKIQGYKTEYGEWPPALFDGRGPLPSNVQLADCKLVRDRMDIIRAMPVGCRFAEIGTLYGDFAVRILDLLKPSALHIFDMSFRNVRPENMQRLEAAKTEFHAGCSWDEMTKMPPGSFDVVYVDADHSFTAASNDLEQALRMTRKGGWIIANDYTGWSWPQCKPYGVFCAVNAFAVKHDLKFEFFALQANGYYDVALRV